MPENQTVWKFDNQGFKAAVFINMGRRGGDGQLGWRGHGVAAARRQQPAERAVPRSCVVGKDWER